MSDSNPIDHTMPRGAPPTPVDLAEFDDAYDRAEPASPSEVPDGRHQVRTNEVRLGRSRAGAPMITYDLVVLSGPHAGRHIFKNAVITESTLPLVKGDLKALGLVLPRFSKLPAYLQDLAGIALEITKLTKGEYTNVYFNKRIPPRSDEPAKSDEVPF